LRSLLLDKMHEQSALALSERIVVIVDDFEEVDAVQRRMGLDGIAAAVVVTAEVNHSLASRVLAAALPPDVRQGSALPESNKKPKGAMPVVRALPLHLSAEGRPRGVAPTLFLLATAGQSPAAHPGAEPERRILRRGSAARPGVEPLRKTFEAKK